MNAFGFASGDPVNFSDPFGLLDCQKDPPCENPNRAGAVAERMVSAAKDLLVGLLDTFNDVADMFVGVKSAATAAGMNPAEQSKSERVLAGAMVVGGLGDLGPGLAKGVARTIKRAQGAAVRFDRVGRFTRATWEVAGDKGAGYVKWNRILSEEGNTVRLYKDVYNQGGNFERRDWYFGQPRK
jgi:hypothetical protein